MFFLEDAQGNLVMQDLLTPKCTFVEEYVEKLSGKTYPKTLEYEFQDGEKRATWRIAMTAELETRYPHVPGLMRPLLKLKGLDPSTSRNIAQGTLELHDGEKCIERSGEMIYEFVYMGATVREKMEASSHA